MKNFIVFDIMSASIRETSAWNDCKTIGAKREVHSVCVFVLLHACVHTPGHSRSTKCVL